MNEITVIHAFSDNFIYLYKYAPNKVIAIDSGDSKPVLKELEKNNLSLTAILLTHHHSDHIGGISELKSKTGCKIIGSDKKRIHPIDEVVSDKQILYFDNINIEVIATPGHTSTSVCYYIPKNKELKSGIIFTGDTLFIGGCGRIFECSAETMWNSFQKLAALPDDTKVYCGHDYTLENYKFALQEEPNNPLILKRITEIKQSQSTVPSTIAREEATNVFVKAGNPEEFAKIRQKKDNF
ncbi:MAG: hydroxyacylglutathione hydrolase [Sedimentisphaerales bacterium]|nr:hydroxyacylglutathione hydrolase [Sedimentisphaerales bacterium]